MVLFSKSQPIWSWIFSSFPQVSITETHVTAPPLIRPVNEIDREQRQSAILPIVLHQRRTPTALCELLSCPAVANYSSVSLIQHVSVCCQHGDISVINTESQRDDQ